MRISRRRATEFRHGKVLARRRGISILKRGLSDGVTVAQLPLEEFVMVRIHVGQPTHLGFPLRIQRFLVRVQMRETASGCENGLRETDYIFTDTLWLHQNATAGGSVN